MNKHLALSLTIILSASLVACAATPGLQTFDLPVVGTYRTDLGAVVNVVPITQHNIHQLRQPIRSTASYDHITHVSRLFKNQTTIEYRLKPYDTLSISMWAYPEITPPNTTNNTNNGYQIDHQGFIQLPLVGRYRASGKTVAQITQELRQLFSRYLKQPDVIVRTLSYQSEAFSVQGNVTRGGQFYLNNQPVSVYQALGLAGGITDKGDNTAIQLIRDGETYILNPLALEQAGFSLHHLLLQANDTVYVNAKESQKIYVMGESGRNQAITLREQGMSLSDALGESLGINAVSASSQRIYVLRSDEKQQQTYVYVMDLSNLGNFGLANQFVMNRNDIVYVDATGLARWQRVINQLLPFSSAINGIQNLTN